MSAARRVAISQANYLYTDYWVLNCDDWYTGQTIDEQVTVMLNKAPDWTKYGHNSKGTI